MTPTVFVPSCLQGTIPAGSRTFEVTSSLDLFPTASALAGVPLPTDRVYDGRDMSDVLLKEDGACRMNGAPVNLALGSRHRLPSGRVSPR